jgi:hypothetical protein
MPPSTGSKSTEAHYAGDYATAQSVIKAGHLIKIVAAVVAGGITVFSGFILCLAIVTAADSASTPISLLFGIGGICGGIVTGIALYAIGILVSTAGQILSAALDTAVHTASLESDGRVTAFRPSIVRERADHAP